jgi:hypothetical protein
MITDINKKTPRTSGYPHATLQDIRAMVEQKLQAMLARNPLRMNYEGEVRHHKASAPKLSGFRPFELS